MRKRFRVKRLEDMAFGVSYREILANLAICPDHRPENSRNLFSYSSLLSTNHFFTSTNVMQYVRNKLSMNLVGTYSDEVRRKFLKEFNNYLSDDEKIEPWVFYDCVLEESFSELEAQVCFFDSVSADAKIVEIISHFNQSAIFCIAYYFGNCT